MSITIGGSTPPPAERVRTPPPTPGRRALYQPLTPERRDVLKRPLPLTPSRVSQRVRTPQWDSAFRRLRDLAEANKQRCLSEPELQFIQQEAQDAIARNDPKELLMLLKVLSEFVVFGTKEIFFAVLAALRERDPGLECLFRNIPDARDEGPSLTPFAINDLFRFYEEEYRYHPGVLSCQPLSQLIPLVDEFIASPDLGPCPMRGWAIYNDELQDDPHIVPVFMIRYQEQNHIFIFDSLGHVICKDKARRLLSFSLRKLSEHFKSQGARAHDVVIYSCKLQRQWGNVGCATFSVLDLKHLYERHQAPFEHIVEFYRAQQEETLEMNLTNLGSKSVPVYEVFNVPPEMMTATQSYRALDRFQEIPPQLDEREVPVVERLSPSGEIERKSQDFSRFSEIISATKRIGPEDHPRNSYLMQKRLSDIVTLITRHYDRNAPSQQELFPHGFEEVPAEVPMDVSMKAANVACRLFS